MKPDRNRPITIEDLIRLKRAERPPAEFWTQFDRELRAKQLAALVAKRPWWQSMPTVSIRGFYRFRLPLGAAAVLGLTFLSIRDYRAPSAAPKVEPGTFVEAVAVAPSTGPGTSPSFASASASSDLSVETGATATPVEVSAPVTVAANAVQPHEVFAFEQQPNVSLFEALNNQPIESSARTGGMLPDSLVSAAMTNPAGTRLLGAKTGFESRALPTRVAVEPLQQMTSPGETRRARLLTAMVSSASMESSPRTTERVASRIAEERLYDQVQRFGARGDRLNVKF